MSVRIRAADGLLPRLSGVRQRGNNRWIALCPAHEDKDPSLTIRQAQDRVLVHCWAGCAVTDICSAIGIMVGDLFNDRRHDTLINPLLLRRLRAAENLEHWRQSEIRRIAEDLRLRDRVIRYIDQAVNDGVLSEVEGMLSLSHEYDGYSSLEYQFDRLVRNQDTLELWRESRRGL